MTRPSSPGSPRERIVTAALAIFAERGFAAASIQQIADAAGMSKQALLHHFPAKVQLRDGVYELLAERLRATFPAIAGALVSRSTERYREVVVATFAQVGAERAVARFLVFELLEDPDALRAWVLAETAPWMGLLRGVAQQWAPPPTTDDEDIDALVMSLVLTMFAHHALVPTADPALHDRIQSAALRVLLRGAFLAPLR
jgi:TetR/AcrR family transcriptional regulator